MRPSLDNKLVVAISSRALFNFLSGLDNSPILERFKPHIFFDDQRTHCERACGIVPTGHVPYGVDRKVI
ncbi:hypothetical protein JCM14036_25180 [Desulfotomaculum defluvii]